MIKFASLGSGSAGNVAVIQFGKHYFLLDIGLSFQKISEGLKSLNLSLEQIEGIFITHEHRDHTKGLELLTRFYKIPLYANFSTSRVIEENSQHTLNWSIFQNECQFSISDIEVCTFPVSHDAVDPVGFIFTYDSFKMAIVSDTGKVTGKMRQYLKDADFLFLESNYDENLLLNSDRPWWLKQRIDSDHGHLSNSQALDLVHFLGRRLSCVVFGHLSKDCNTFKNVLQELRNLYGDSLPFQVMFASPNEVTGWISLKSS